MLRVLAIGFGAGIAATLMFASVASGTVFAMPLFLLSPLPIAIAALGWGWLSGAVGALVATVAVGSLATPPVAASFFLLLAAPIVWLAYLAGLSRAPDAEAGQPGPATLEWYPLGRVLMHAALAVAGGLVVTGLIVGFDADAVATETLAAVEAWMGQNPQPQTMPDQADLEALVRVNVALMPYTVSTLALFVLVFNLWLAGRVTAVSDLLRRPWEPMWVAVLPRWLAGLLAGAIVVAALTTGPAAAAAGAVTGATGFAFSLSGLAAIHALTIGRPGRPALLAGLYVVVLLFGFPLFLVMLFGIADSTLDLRARRRNAGGPST